MKPETIIGGLAITGLIVIGLWRLFRWFGGGKSGPNPWGDTIEESIQQPDASPICRRCLEPHEEYARYCPHCGIPVDSMVPLSPFHYAFAIGDVLLTGTQRKFPVNWITITGFIFLSTIQYLIFAPVYWFRLIRNIKRLKAEEEQPRPESTPSPEAAHRDEAS